MVYAIAVFTRCHPCFPMANFRNSLVKVSCVKCACGCKYMYENDVFGYAGGFKVLVCVFVSNAKMSFYI